MSTLREIIYDVRERYNAYSDDSKLSDEHIAFMVMNVRNMLTGQAMSNPRKAVPKEALQVVCVNMAVDSQCFDEFDVLKSSLKLPATLDNTGRKELYRVHASGSRFVKNINVIDYSRLPFVNAEKYNGNQLYISVDHQNYLIGYNTQGKHLLLESLPVEAVFENPEQAYELSCEYDANVDFMDVPFPIDGGQVAQLVDEVAKRLMLKYQVPSDDKNDAEDIAVQAPQKQRR